MESVIYQFKKEHFLSVFSTGHQAESLAPKMCLSFEKYSICELAELKVHWAQPWIKHD